jgi:outer membrane receptor protein involved in Fe transport
LVEGRGAAGRSLGVCGAVLALSLPGIARTAEVLRTFDIPDQPREEALLALSGEAGISLGFARGVHCSGRAGVHGRLTLGEALDTLLAGSDCAARTIDPRTVEIVARPGRPPAPPRRAQPGASQRPAEPAAAAPLSELVVTATKRDMRLGGAPYSLTAIPGETLVRFGVPDTGGLPALAAGVTVTNLGPGRDKILLRGLSDGPLTGHTQSTVGIYFGELRLTYNAPDPDLRWTDVSRVEVLRGPQGSLYGSGSIGGIVQVVPTAPDPSARSGWLGATAETTAHGDPSGVLEGALNQPFADGKGAVRLVGWSEVAGGYIDNLATGRSDVDRTTRTGGRAALLWAPTGDFSLEASLIDQAISTRDAHYAQPAVGALARATAYAEPHDNDFLAASLTVRWGAPIADLTVTTGLVNHQVGSLYDATDAPTSLVLPGAAPATFHDENDIRGVVSEARLVSRSMGRVQWLAGAFASAGAQRLATDLTDTAGRIGYAEIRHDDLDEEALFGEVSYALTSRLTLTAGGRFFASQLQTNSQVSLGAAVQPFSGATHDTGFAPKFVAAWRLSPETNVYVQASEGYRTSGFNTAGPIGQSFGATFGAPQPLRRYAGDELWSYEAGVRWTPADGAARVRAALFHASWRHIQADLLLPSGLPFTANLGDGQSTGVEVEAARRIGALTLNANLTLQDPELQSLDPGFASRPDSRLPGVPALAFALMADYERPLGAGWTLEVAPRFAYVGPSRLAFGADLAPSMGDYGDLRLSAALKTDRLRIVGYVENATDSRGDTFAYGNPFSLRVTPQTTPQRPRTVGVSVTRNF